MNEPRVYSNKPFALIVILLLFGGMIFLLATSLGGLEGYVVLPFLLFMVILFLFILFSVTSKAILSEDEITSQTLLGAKTLRWTEIDRVSGRGYAIKLHNRDGDVTVAPSPNLPGYEEIIEIIGRKRPDLFSPMEYSEMKRGLVGMFGAILLLALMFVWLPYFFITQAANSTNDPAVWVSMIVFLIIIVMTFYSTFVTIPRVITLEGPVMTLKYFFNEKTITAGEVSSIRMSYTQTRNGKHYFILLGLSNHKSMRLSGLSPSLPIAYLVMKNWHANHSQGQFGQSSPPNIAPNWSDNSQN